ncbi:AAA family ATPase [Phenylobacterium sp.]|uniref:AAA family ATPase n=1 Tax=Phenylobacterium sp. TaxID=1871053 RepID=UPI002F3F25F6
MIHKPNFFVLTGGPGVGKTTLLRHLEALGERVVGETARGVIREQVATGGVAVPWADNDAYVRACAARDIAGFDALAHEAVRIFFDRGIMDSYGANGALPWRELEQAIRTRRYNETVFVFPPWREIYETDAERKQDWAEAEATFDKVMTVMAKLGYRPLVVPTGPVEARADFVLAAALRATPSPP